MAAYGEIPMAAVKILAATFAHDEAGVRGLCRTLVRHEVMLVAIERPDGLLVERLLEAGLRILPLHPNQVAATRDRFRGSPRRIWSRPTITSARRIGISPSWSPSASGSASG